MTTPTIDNGLDILQRLKAIVLEAQARGIAVEIHQEQIELRMGAKLQRIEVYPMSQAQRDFIAEYESTPC